VVVFVVGGGGGCGSKEQLLKHLDRFIERKIEGINCVSALM